MPFKIRILVLFIMLFLFSFKSNSSILLSQCALGPVHPGFQVVSPQVT